MLYIEIRWSTFHLQGTRPTDGGMNVIPLPVMALGKEELSWSSVTPSPISMLNSSDSHDFLKFLLSDFNIELGEGVKNTGSCEREHAFSSMASGKQAVTEGYVICSIYGTWGTWLH